MLTTFDEVYKVFLRLVKGVECYSLPQTIQEQKDLIELGTIIFNREREGNEIVCDMVEETVATKNNEKLSSNEVLLLAYCMGLQIHRDVLTELTSMLSVATKDSSLKDYKGQISARTAQVTYFDKLINDLVFTMSEFEG